MLFDFKHDIKLLYMVTQQKKNCHHHINEHLIGSFIVILLVWGTDSTLTSEFVHDKLCCSNFKGLVSMASRTSPVGSLWIHQASCLKSPSSLVPLSCLLSQTHIQCSPHPSWGMRLWPSNQEAFSQSPVPVSTCLWVVESQVHLHSVWHLQLSLHRQDTSQLSHDISVDQLLQGGLGQYMRDASGQYERQSWHLDAEGIRGADHYHLLTFKLGHYITLFSIKQCII